MGWFDEGAESHVRHLARFPMTSFATGNAAKAFGQPA
jgi:hypothetical protein